MVAKWRPVKGLISFITAASRVLSVFPSARFVLAGQGQQKHELISVTQKLGIKDRVLFIENPPKVHEILPAFDVAVQPSLSEGFSNVLIEYMDARRLIVVTRVRETQRVIENGREGLLVEPDNPDALSDAIIDLLHNPNDAARFGKFARKNLNPNWSSSKILKTYQKYYQILIADKV